MAFRLSRIALQNAIKHICKYGDTDVFPHLPEISFLREQSVEVTEELMKLDLESYMPSSAIEALGPKSRFGFRIVHQLSIVDTILLLASVIEIGSEIELRRGPSSSQRAFSYRFEVGSDGGLFSQGRTYKDWLKNQLELIRNNLKIKQIILTDISDFYARVNFHRLENLLDEAAPGSGAGKYIKKHIKVIRAKQSFGLPVGGSAARLLAELALSDTDTALQNDGLIATRFVDDFRIFLPGDKNAYDALSVIAEQLAINEGLALNVAKTHVETRAQYLDRLKTQLSDVTDEAESAALDALTTDIYFDDEPDPDQVAELKGFNLLQLLKEEIEKHSLEIGKIRILFRAIKIARPFEAVEYIKNNFKELVIFAKDITLLMQELEDEYNNCFDSMADEIIDTILSPPASSMQLIKTWLIELLVRGTVPIDIARLKKLESLNTPNDKRQLLLMRGKIGDVNFFRRNKTAFGQFSPPEQTCIIWGASCLPYDEYKSWLTTIKPMMAAPISDLFLKWAQKHHSNLLTKLEFSTDDHD